MKELKPADYDKARPLLPDLLDYNPEGITQGSDTGNATENLQGVKDGEYFLTLLEKCPHDHFYGVLDKG